MGVRGEAELGRAGQRATSCPSSTKSRLHPVQAPPCPGSTPTRLRPHRCPHSPRGGRVSSGPFQVFSCPGFSRAHARRGQPRNRTTAVEAKTVATEGLCPLEGGGPPCPFREAPKIWSLRGNVPIFNLRYQCN